MLPGDAHILLSYVNTQLRDRDLSLADLAAEKDSSEEEILEKLKTIGYVYREDLRRFVPEESA